MQLDTARQPACLHTADGDPTRAAVYTTTGEAADDRLMHLPHSVLAATVEECTDLDAFLGSWMRLPIDRHMADGGRYRRRRYSSFRIVNDHLAALPHGTFFQSTDVNAVNGGVPRLFDPIEQVIARSDTLRRIVLSLKAVLPAISVYRSLISNAARELACGVHQIRITASDAESGHPAPEGIHRDGHDFVGQVLIHRGAVSGGGSVIYDLDRTPIYSTTLLHPLEAIVIDDRRVLHSVEPIMPSHRGDDSGAGTAVRDMLLVDFFAAP